MKFEIAAMAAASCCISAMAAASVCGPESEASVYYLNSDRRSSKHTPLVNLQQGQMVLSDFTGTSKLYSLENSDDARLVASLKSTGLFSTLKKSDTIVVAVDNLKEHAAEKATNVGEDGCSKSLGEMPAFHIKDFPDFEAISSVFSTLIGDIESVTGRIAQSWRAGVSVFPHSSGAGSHYKRMVNEYYSQTAEGSSKLEEDINSIKAVAQHTNDESVILHLQSLNGLSAEDLPQARADILKAIKNLAKEQPNTRIAVLAIPAERCADVQQHRAGNHHHHRVPSAGSFSKRAAAPKATKLTTLSTFETEEDCLKLTNSCSGHGSCKKVNPISFACVCGTSYNQEKSKTTRWGGNACQKKDVSAETQMFLWTGVVIILVLAASVQLLFSIADDPLPGVLNVSSKRS